jgi:hypothetical protein
MTAKFAFGAHGIEQTQVDIESGTLSGVSLISVGPALGHGLYVDDASLDSLMLELEGAKLPAYITHRGAIFDDRLTREIGMFDNFRIEGDRLVGDFQAFDSFREDESKKFNRLFELAEKMPERFGLSIVFTATAVWATENGDVDTLERPDDALFDFPSIRVDEVSSADFVDQPAANQRGLFSKIDIQLTNKMTKLQLAEENQNLEAQKTELKNQVLQLSIEKTEAEAKAEALEFKLAEKLVEDEEMREEKTLPSAKPMAEGDEVEDEEVESDVEVEVVIEDEDEDEVVEEEVEAAEDEEEEQTMESKLSDALEEIERLKKSLAEKDEDVELAEKSAVSLSARVDTLEGLIQGSPTILAAKQIEDYEPSKSSRAPIISEYAKKNKISEFSATLRLGKERPELFKI